MMLSSFCFSRICYGREKIKMLQRKFVYVGENCFTRAWPKKIGIALF